MKKQKAEFYEREYRNIIRSAFSEPERNKLRLKLFDALAYMDTAELEKTVDVCNSLLPRCVTPHDFCAVLTIKAVCCENMKMLESAIDLYYEALGHDEAFSVGWFRLGVVFTLQEKYRDAIGCLNKALQYDKNDFMSYDLLARIFFLIGEYYLSIENAQKALEISPKLFSSMTMLCLSYAVLKDNKKSDEYFEMAILNGENKGRITKYLDSVRKNTFKVKSIEPLTEEQWRSLDDFYYSTAVPMLWASIPAGRGKS